MMEQMEVESKMGNLEEELRKQREADKVASWLGVEDNVVEEMDRKVEVKEVKKESVVDKRIEAAMGRVEVAMKEKGKMERDIEYLEQKVQDYTG